jgi:hypothetical protein
MSDLPLDKENRRRNAYQTPGLPTKVVASRTSTAAAVTTAATTPSISIGITSTTSSSTTANDAAMRPPSPSKVLRKRWIQQYASQKQEQHEHEQQQQPRLMEQGPVQVFHDASNKPPEAVPVADSDLLNTTCDSTDQSLGFFMDMELDMDMELEQLEPKSARKNCNNPVAQTLLHSDDDDDCSVGCSSSPHHHHYSSTSSWRQSPLECSARVPVENVTRPVARPAVSPQLYFYHQQQHQHQQQQQQQQYYYNHEQKQQQQHHVQQQQQQQQQYYQQQPQQQRPYYQPQF